MVTQKSSWLFLISLGVVSAACEPMTRPSAPPAIVASGSTLSSPAAGPIALVGYDLSGDLDFIDTATETVLSTLSVGAATRDLDFSPDGKTAYVMSYRNSTVSVIDIASMSVLKTLSVPHQPNDLEVSPDGAFVYVASFTELSAIDTRTNAVSRSLSLISEGLAVSPDGAKIYATAGSRKLAVIDVASFTITRFISFLGFRPTRILLSPDGSTAYIKDIGNDSVMVLDLVTGTVLARVFLNALQPLDFAITPDGSHVYVTQPRAITVIETATHTISAQIPLLGYGIDFGPDGSKAYVTVLSPTNAVKVIDTSSLSVVSSIPVSRDPLVIAVGPAIANEGCDLQFWRANGRDAGWTAWHAAGFSPWDGFDATFETSSFGPDFRLADAVRSPGTNDEARIARFGTAALLNAGHPDVHYPFNVDEVLTAVRTADGTALWAMAAAMEELNCPLD